MTEAVVAPTSAELEDMTAKDLHEKYDIPHALKAEMVAAAKAKLGITYEDAPAAAGTPSPADPPAVEEPPAPSTPGGVELVLESFSINDSFAVDSYTITGHGLEVPAAAVDSVLASAEASGVLVTRKAN